MTLPIYLDYMATTPVDPLVIEQMKCCMDLSGFFGNPASTHEFGRLARERVELARGQVASLIGASPREIVWTSGATESNNLAIIGAARFYQRKGRHIITVKTEHKAVLDPCKYLEKEGFNVTYLTPQENGLLDLAELKSQITADTVLISVMHVNNEIGVIQDIAKISEIAHEKGAILHVDGAQSAGKIPVDVVKLDVDLMSFSAHKIYGPKGIGALYVKRQPRIRLEPLIYGGGHENGMRAGTLATHQIVGMGEAFKIAQDRLNEDYQTILNLRNKFWDGIKNIPGIRLNGDLENRIPGNLNVSFEDIEGESLVFALKDLALSTGSACSAASIKPSYVLCAIGLSDLLAHSAIRLSIGRFTKEQDIDLAIDIINQQISRLRALSA